MVAVNYKMIELARNARGLSHKDLFKLLPTSYHPNISTIERGELAVTSEGIEHFAKALNFPVSFFYQEETKMPISAMYFRKRETLPVKAFNKIYADLKIVRRAIDILLEEVDLQEYPKYIFDIKDGWTPASIAVRLREIMLIHEGMPVTNLVKRIEEMGIIVFLYDAQHEKFDGLTAYTDKGTPVIFVNKNMPADRLKYTIVHELIHLVAHIPCDVEPWREYEQEANQGAAEFLLPTKEFARDARGLSYLKLAELKSYWGVSKAAIIRRAKDLGLITPETYTYLNIELGRRGERKTETGFVTIDKPAILDTVISLYKGELQYTDDVIAEKLSLNIVDYYRFFGSQGQPVLRLTHVGTM